MTLLRLHPHSREPTNAQIFKKTLKSIMDMLFFDMDWQCERCLIGPDQIDF